MYYNQLPLAVDGSTVQQIVQTACGRLFTLSLQGLCRPHWAKARFLVSHMHLTSCLFIISRGASPPFPVSAGHPCWTLSSLACPLLQPPSAPASAFPLILLINLLNWPVCSCQHFEPDSWRLPSNMYTSFQVQMREKKKKSVNLSIIL